MSTHTVGTVIPQWSVGDRLRKAREVMGLSQSEFAQATGVSQRSVSRYESLEDAAEIRRPVLLAWAFATGVSMDWLLTGSAGPHGSDGLPHLDSNQKPFGMRLGLAPAA